MKRHELRCFCRHKPLLATYGIKNGILFVHVKVYKQDRIFGELFIEGGKVKLKCRDCLRWHIVRISQDQAVLRETDESTLVLNA